jgi:hypothetical protein
MLLAGPAPAASLEVEQDGAHAGLPATQSGPLQAEPLGNAIALPSNRFGPDNFKGFERNGF